MQISTTVRVSVGTRDQLRRLADDDEVTLDDEISRLVRAERQRRMGVALSMSEPGGAERSWLEMGADVMVRHAGG